MTQPEIPASCVPGRGPVALADGIARAAAVPATAEREWGEPDRESTKASTILVVDDEPVCVKVLCRYLRDAGYRNVIAVTDSTQAMEVALREAPGVLLLDVHMPQVTGLDILRRRAADDRLKHIPAIMLTASSDPNVKLEALQLGATDFLGKPVDPNDLVPRVGNALVIKAHRDNLESLNARLESRVREQTVALSKAYEDLRGLDRLKHEFLVLVSHELRTPINGVLTAVELLGDDRGLDAGQGQDLLVMARQQVRLLQHIVEDVEAFLRLTAGSIALYRGRVAVGSFLEDHSEGWERQAAAKGLSWELIVGEPVEVLADSRLLKDCLDRLVHNAVKFTARGGVTLGVSRRGERAAIELLDTGCGIEVEDQGRILDPLCVGGRIEHHREGRGLGLSIARRQAKIMGGELEFESRGKDQGSVFRILLPLARVEPGRGARPEGTDPA